MDSDLEVRLAVRSMTSSGILIFWQNSIPLPAGTLIVASVRTRVVSWKLAAEMNESVLSEALVIPSSSG